MERRSHMRRRNPTWLAASSIVATLLLQACGGDSTGPAVATMLTLTTAPSTSAADGVVFATQPVVQLQDANGNAVAQSGIVMTASITAGGGTLGGTVTATTATSGAATFTNLSIAGTTGAQTLTFAATGLTSATATVMLTAGTAAMIAVNTGNNQLAIAGAAVATAPSVKVTDANGNAVSGVSVTFAVASGGGSITGGTQAT